MTWFTANQVSVNNGSTIVTVTSGEDISNIRAGDALIVGSFSPVEINRAYVDGSNNKIIELKSAWADSNQSNAAARVFPTAGDFKEAANALRAATQLTSDQFQTLTDWGTTNGTVTFTDSSGQQYTARSLAKMDADVAEIEATANNLVGSVVLPTKADFESRYEGVYAGAGFVEWGKHTSDGTKHFPVNEGITTWANSDQTSGTANRISLGRNSVNATVSGTSKTEYPRLYLSGCIINLLHSGNEASRTYNFNLIKFPDAPDGLDKVDGTGRFASLAEAITAGGTSLSASVIHRQDLCILEVFDVNITTSGLPLYPNGNCQYTDTWSGITLADNLVAQGYSAFYVGDTATKGKGFLPNLTNSAHVKFLQDKDNNCYTNEDGDIIQRQYRIRTIAGLNGAWENVTSDSYLRFSNTARIKPKGQLTNITTDLAAYNVNESGYYASESDTVSPILERGMFKAHNKANTGVDTAVAYNGNCWAIPIALVQRRNQGAYHPVYNIAGTAHFLNLAGDWDNAWYHQVNNSASKYNGWLPQSASDCFLTTGEGRRVYGNIANGASKSGRPDDMFYDAIYASDVKDLRMSAHYVDYDTVNRVENAKNINASARGWEATPFTKTVSGVVLRYSAVFNLSSTAFSNNVFGDDLRKSYLIGGGNGSDILLLKCKHDSYTSTGTSAGNSLLYAKWLVGGDNLGTASSIASQVEARLGVSADSTDGSNYNTYNSLQWISCELLPYYQSEPTWTDIIADPAVLVATFPDGVAGSWIPVIPDGTSKTANLTEKQIGMLSWVYTNNNGTSWTSQSPSAFNNTNNSSTASYSAPNVSLISYQSKANFVEPANLTKVLSDFSDVVSSNSYLEHFGCILAQSILGKIPVANIGVPEAVVNVITFNRKPTVKSNGFLEANRKNPDHNSTGLYAVSSPALKHFTYIIERNGQLYQQIIAKEMVYDAVDGFGDDNVFEVTDGVKTKTDLNGNTVIYGCWERPLPYFTNNKVN